MNKTNIYPIQQIETNTEEENTNTINSGTVFWQLMETPAYCCSTNSPRGVLHACNSIPHLRHHNNQKIISLTNPYTFKFGVCSHNVSSNTAAKPLQS